MSNTTEIRKKQFGDTVYSKFSDVPSELITNGYVRDQAIEAVLSKCRGYYAQKLVQDEVTAKLTTLINLLSLREEVHVLDYGGGLGQIYHAVEKHLVKPEAVQWQVLDVEEMIVIARKRAAEKPNVRFYSHLREIKQADILLLRQSLQVLEQPYEVLKNIVRALDPKIIFLSGVPAGDNESYVSLLLCEETRGGACWILNEAELIRSITGMRFVLVDRFLENITINLANFPDKHQLDGERKNHVKGYIFLKEDVLLNQA